MVLAGKSIRFRDDACKVHAIRNKVIFVSAGINGFGPEANEVGNSWSAYDEPGKLAGQIPDTADDPVNFLAKLWGESVKQRLNRALLVNPDATIRFWHKEGEQGLTTGVFAGLTKQGQFVIYKAALNCDCAGASRRAFLTISPLPVPNRTAIAVIGTEEAQALYNELVEDRSERARASGEKFGADHAAMPRQELLGAAAVASLEFILKYTQATDFGGPIDAVEMSSTGKVRWIQRKANCPDDR